VTFDIVLTLLVFFGVYGAITFDLIDKSAASLLGASILLIFKIIPADVAFSKVDLHVILLLTSLMIIVNIIRRTGFFQFVAIKAAIIAKGNPLRLLLLLCVITGIISAILDNVTTIMILSPLAILCAVELGLSPIPYLITMAIASNIGGTATLIGDPPNIMIGSGANLTFTDFLINETPLIIIIGASSILLTYLLFRSTMKTTPERMQRLMKFDDTKAITDKPLLIKSMFVLTFMIIGFLFQNMIGLSPAVLSLAGAAILMITAKTNSHENFSEVEWGTIFFFIGLFIMVGAMEELGIIKSLGQILANISGGSIKGAALTIIWGTGIFSGFIDNIPFVAMMIPIIHTMNTQLSIQDNNVLWWALSSGACLGGNFTLIGASANIIASGIAEKSGYHLSFREFTKYGVIYTLLSLVLTTLYIFIRYL
jgi:Na+/H+ antiporter NhaD/arsenite permease-like protein